MTCHVDDKAVEQVTRQPSAAKLFACSRVGITPDFLCVAKGLTGGYLPMAATLTTQKVFDAFLGEYEEFKTFFHGHSFTGNQLGATASLASLDILQTEKSVRQRRSYKKIYTKNCNRSGRCRMSATSDRSAWSQASNSSKTGRRANRLRCVNVQVSVCARRWPNAAC